MVSLYKIGTLQVWALGITIVIGGQYFAWNAALSSGFGSTLFCTLLVTLNYFGFCFSMAEVASTFPISGGAFGLARVTLGFFPGYVVGICEALEYICYVSASVISLGSMIASVAPVMQNLQPLIWLAFYTVSCFIHIVGGRTLWHTMVALAVISVGVVVLFVFGSIPFVDFKTNAVPDLNWMKGGLSELMFALPLPVWFFVGVEILAMTGGDVRNYKSNIPNGMLACILTLAICAVAVLFTFCSLPSVGQSPTTNPVPFNSGFLLIFPTLTSQTATLLSLPATFATAFGFIYAYGRVILALGESQLLPRICTFRSSSSGEPYAGIIIGSVIGFLFCLLFTSFSGLSGSLFNICVCCALMGYLAQMSGYIMLNINFRQYPRGYVSPLGVSGALLTMIISLLIFLSIAMYQNDNHFAFIIFVCLIGSSMIPYFTYYKYTQTISKTELKVLGKLHKDKYLRARSESARRKGNNTLSDSSFSQHSYLGVEHLLAKI